jgi:threonine dehydrogenase-like Zn-dependent dehydrogenase
MTRKNILIIGAGQIGSRHLQGTLRMEGRLRIYVVDPSDSSLHLAEERSREINHSHELFFHKQLDTVPNVLDMVIIATSADVRENVILDIFGIKQIKNLILEKVLFQSPASYDRVFRILKENRIPTWVNLPLRTYKHYRQIKSLLSEQAERLTLNVAGSNWRIACNAIHYIDLFEFLSDSTVEFINQEWLDPEIFPSKRKGIVEFNGTLTALTTNKSSIMINSFPGDFVDTTVYISTASHRIIVQEGGIPSLIHLNKAEAFKAVPAPVSGNIKFPQVGVVYT